jgi:hypothetical protein
MGLLREKEGDKVTNLEKPLLGHKIGTVILSFQLFSVR